MEEGRSRGCNPVFRQQVTGAWNVAAFAHGAAGQADDHVVVVGGSGEGTDEAFALAT